MVADSPGAPDAPGAPPAPVAPGGVDARLREQIGRQESRKLAARRRGPTVFAWFGTFGVVGWSVAVPALLGVAVGRWLDRGRLAGPSWTLTLLILGLAAGCWNAWYWVRRESRSRGDGP